MALSVKVKEVKPLSNLWLYVRFENGAFKYFDIKNLITNFPVYKELYNEDIFQLVKVDCGGCAVAWTDEIDISECELWENGVSCEQYLKNL